MESIIFILIESEIRKQFFLKEKYSIFKLSTI